MQVVGQGAIIWLEPKGKSKLGIRYPAGLSKNFKNQDPNSRKQKEEGPGDFRRGFFNNREVSVDGNLIKQAQKEMEILIPEKDLKRLVQSVISKSYGIEAKFAYNRDRFIYEIKLPLNKIPEYEFALDTETTDKINIDIESEVPNMKSGPLGGSGSSGFEGMAEGGPLGRGVSDEMPSDGYGMPTDARARMEKIEMKLLVKLAR